MSVSCQRFDAFELKLFSPNYITYTYTLIKKILVCHYESNRSRVCTYALKEQNTEYDKYK